MIKNTPSRLTYMSYGTTTSVEFNGSDNTLEELFNAFKTVLVGATFSEASIIDFIIELGQQYSEYKSYGNE